MYLVKKVKLLLGVGIALLFSSCATVYNKVPIYFSNLTENTTISENGKKIDLGWVVSNSSGDSRSTTIYYRKGIKMPRSKVDRHLTIESNGKKANFTLESQFATGTLICDLWLGVGVGAVVDVVAGPLRTYKVKEFDAKQLLEK